MKWEGNQPLVGWCTPPLAPLCLGLGTLGEGAPPLALGGKAPPSPLWPPPPPPEIPSPGPAPPPRGPI